MTDRDQAGDRRTRRRRSPLVVRNRARAEGRERLRSRLEQAVPLTPHQPARRIPVGLSTSSVVPRSMAEGFEIAERLGYDGMEVMVSAGADTRDPDAIRDLVDKHQIPVLSLHAPTLFFLQKVWGRDPWDKIRNTVLLARDLGVPTVVAHPPFVWQQPYAREFVDGVRRLTEEHGVEIAVENMYPWRLGVREFMAYSPHWDPVPQDYKHVTVDLSHAATAGADVLRMIDDLGERLGHIHLCDGSGSSLKDEHLPPGEGLQPCSEVLRRLANRGWYGTVTVEVNTPTDGPRAREAKLRASLDFAREHLGHHLAPVAGDTQETPNRV
jgi:sugar phosphate isomerase/epimerase